MKSLNGYSMENIHIGIFQANPWRIFQSSIFVCKQFARILTVSFYACWGFPSLLYSTPVNWLKIDTMCGASSYTLANKFNQSLLTSVTQNSNSNSLLLVNTSENKYEEAEGAKKQHIEAWQNAVYTFVRSIGRCEKMKDRKRCVVIQTKESVLAGAQYW